MIIKILKRIKNSLKKREKDEVMKMSDKQYNRWMVIQILETLSDIIKILSGITNDVENIKKKLNIE